MATVNDTETFVKRQIHYHERQAYRLRTDAEKSKFHCEYVEHFKTILALLAGQSPDIALRAQIETLHKELEDIKGRRLALPPTPTSRTDSSVITAADLVGLPIDLIAQLNLPEQDDQEKLILEIITESGGVLSLDKLLIAMWRKTQVVPQKKAVTTKLYRMIGKKLIYKVPGKRGLYTTEPMPDGPDDEQEEPE